MKTKETFYPRSVVYGAALAMLVSGCGGSNDTPQSATDSSQVPAVVTAQSFCSTLVGTMIPSEDIGLPTKGATISSASLVKASDADNTNGEYCKVLGSIHPVDKAAPDIKFEVDLPSNWNQKSVHVGGGGNDGTIPVTTGFANSSFIGAEPPGVLTPLARGFVTYASDSGHTGNMFENEFGNNDEALANYAGEHVKKTHDVTASLVKKRYGTPIKYSYFVGGSGGGRQGLIAAQRYSADYDGVISTFPASNLVGLAFQMGRFSQASLAPGGFINQAKGAVYQAAVFKHCDANDGAVDGIISNPSSCSFDPVVLRCPDGADTGNTCLSDAQLRTLKTISTPLNTNYDLANGIRSVPGLTLAGPDLWSEFLPSLGTSPTDAMKKPFVFGQSSFMYHFFNDMVRYSITRDLNLNTFTFNPADPGPWTTRVQAVSALQDATSTDLTAFQKRGGKLILQHGTSDPLIPVEMTVDYYKRLEARFGGNTLKQFVKFYVVPGAGHGFDGQFAGAYDALTALDNWVTNEKAPTNLVITDLSAKNLGRTRPVCEYPQWPKYVSGDVNLASSFSCTN